MQEDAECQVMLEELQHLTPEKIKGTKTVQHSQI